MPNSHPQILEDLEKLLQKREKAIQRTERAYNFWLSECRKRAEKAEAQLACLAKAGQALVDSAQRERHNLSSVHDNALNTLRAALKESSNK